MLLMVEVLVEDSLCLQICNSSIKMLMKSTAISFDYNSNLVVHNLLQASELEKLANQSRQLCNGSILTRVKLRVTPLHTWQGTVYFLLT